MRWNRLNIRTLVALTVAAALGLVAVPAYADKPSSTGGGKNKSGKSDKSHGSYDSKKSGKRDDDRHSDRQGDRQGDRQSDRQSDRHGDRHGDRDRDRDGRSAKRKHFGDRDRNVVRHYYGEAFRKGKRCPPGLAKKHNGCMPPGQAKKRWTYGQRLPRDVVFYDLPRQLVLELPAPPDGYRYVRVASDILLIAIGTGMVIDAIDSLTSL